MSKIILTNGNAPTELPSTGTFAVYTKGPAPGPAGLYVMDEGGVETGPLSAGGGPPSGAAGGALSGFYPNPVLSAGAVGTINIAAGAVTNTELADDSVTNSKMADNSVNTLELVDLAVQTAKLANDAVTNAKLANAAVTSAKLAMTPVPYGFILSDSLGGPWTGGLPSRIKFASPSRVSILGDIGGADDPTYPRIVNQVGVDFGYLSKTLTYEVKISEDLDLRKETPTVFNVTVSGFETVTLPDSRRYPVGTTIEFVHIGSGILTINQTGTVGGGYANIVGNPPSIPAASQTVIPGQTKRFTTFGSGWYVSREVFARIRELSLANGVSEVNTGTGAAHWNLNPASSSPWIALTAQRFVMFPVDLPYGATLTGIDALVQMTSDPGAGNRTKLRLYRGTLNYTTPTQSSAMVASQEAVGSAALQKVSLTGLTEFLNPSESKWWTVSIESSTNGAPNGDALYGIRLLYTL